MDTNFFNQIAAMNLSGNLQINVQKGIGTSLIVSVILQNDHCTDDAKQCIPPLLLKGTAEELDKGFFKGITTPIAQTSSLLLNIQTYLLAQEEAKRQSAMEKEKAAQAQKEQEAKDKRYKEVMTKVSDLARKGQYQEAWLTVPDPTEFPDKVEEIRKCKKELSAQFATPSLFDEIVPSVS